MKSPPHPAENAASEKGTAMSTHPSHPDVSADAPAITTSAEPAGHYRAGVFYPAPPVWPCVRALEIAMVQLESQAEADPNYTPNDDPAPQDPSEFRLYMAARMANFLGAWRACTFPACARNKRCAGTPPRCFAHLPEPCADEIARAKAAMQKGLAARLG